MTRLRFNEVKTDLGHIKTRLDDLELKSLLNGEVDINSAFISINAGAGGTEAQDWASMLLMRGVLIRWAESAKVIRVELVSQNDGEEWPESSPRRM